MEKIWNFLKDEDGMELVEYAVMASLIVAGLVLVISGLGDAISARLTALTGEID
jgi:Flp pilus assembly pilin Flp